ncbi:MAG: hypothetical protein ACKPAF_05820, partial [Actinomycetota bacterium]
ELMPLLLTRCREPACVPALSRRVTSKGINSGGAAGDLIVTVDVVVPRDLTDKQRKLVEQLAQISDDAPRKYLFSNAKP